MNVNHAADTWVFREGLRRDLRAALKSRQPDTISALRTLIAAIDNAEAIPPDPDPPRSDDSVVALSSPGVGSTEAPRRDLAMADIEGIVRDLLCEYETTGVHYRSIHQHEASDQCRRKAAIVRAYLDA